MIIENRLIQLDLFVIIGKKNKIDKMTEERLINRYGYFVYYDAIEEYEIQNIGYFDDLTDSEKVKILDVIAIQSLGLL